MKFHIARDDIGEKTIVFSGEIKLAEMMRLRLDRFDMALLEGSIPGDSPADSLLALEMLFRRHQEQQP